MNNETRSALSAFSGAPFVTMFEDETDPDVRFRQADAYVRDGISTLKYSGDTALAGFANSVLPLLDNGSIQIVAVDSIADVMSMIKPDFPITHPHLPHTLTIGDNTTSYHGVKLLVPREFMPFADEHSVEALGSLVYVLSVAQAEINALQFDGLDVNRRSTWNKVRVFCWALDDTRIADTSRNAFRELQQELLGAYPCDQIPPYAPPRTWDIPPQDPGSN